MASSSPRQLDLAGRMGQHGQAILFAPAHHPHMQQGTAGHFARRRPQVQAGHHLAHRTRGHDPAAGEQHHGGREAGHLLQRMAHEQDRDAGLVAEPVEIGEDLGLAGLVQGGQRLVQQQQARAGQQRPADRHALPLAAREHAGPPLQQRADAQQARPPRRGCRAAAVAGEPAAVEQVATHGEVREQPGVLEDIADAPPMAGHVDPVRGVEQRLAIEDDPAARRAGAGRRSR